MTRAIDAAVKVSIVVPTYAREERLCTTLADLLRQAWPASEVIVVDQTPAHQPATARYLAALGPRVRLLHQERPSVVAAVNRGVRAASGEIVLFVDDDIAIPDQDLIAAHVQNYADGTVGGVAGRVLAACDPRPGRFDPRSADAVWGFFHTGWDHDVRCDVTTAPGANMSFRRELVVRLGGFDERFTGNAFRWESDFCLRLRRAGYRTVYDPRPTVHHFYGTAGGNENRHLHGREAASHAWYRDFFHNQAYVTLKHMPRSTLPRLLWRLYRGHVMNAPYAREGLGFLAARHRAMLAGLGGAVRSYRAWREECGRGR